jgi:hypothetical protein
MQKSVCSHKMSDASKIKYVCIHLVSFALFNDGVRISECRNCLTYAVVIRRKVWLKSNCAQLGTGIHMVEYIGIHKAVWLKTKIQHTGTWMPAALLRRHLGYGPGIFFRNMSLIALPFAERKIQNTFQKCNSFIVSTFLKLHTYENNALPRIS